MKYRSFLATTALEEFWDRTQPILFLGEWCKLYERKSAWQNLDSQTLQCPSLEKSHSIDAYHYTIGVYEKILPQFVNWLNKIHGTNYSLKYWRIVIGPFLLWYIQIVYHRFIYLKTAYSYYPDITTIGLTESSYVTPISTAEFCQFAAESDAWNLQLMTQILKLALKPPASYREFNWKSELQQRIDNNEKYLPYKITTLFKFYLTRILTTLRASRTTGLFCALEFNKKNLYSLMFTSRLRILPLTQIKINERDSTTNVKLDLSVREEISKLSVDDDFSKLVIDTLKANIPINFIELYKHESSKSRKCFPYSAATIVGVGISNDRFKFWSARMAEQGAKLVGMQHGGGYGAVRYCTYEFLERTITDKFISWGWNDGNNIVPASSVNVCERNSDRQTRNININKDIILWASTEVDRYLAYIAGNFNHMQNIYFDWQEKFISNLSSNVVSQIVMRLRPAAKYTNYIKDRFSTLNIHISTDKGSFFKQLDTAKILICDNLNTTFHYALAFNIPTILFWDKNLFQIRESAKSYFKALHQAGIYHDSPESAAAMLNNVADDPSKWWNSETVQQARKTFCYNYAKMTPDWIDEWKNILCSI